MPHGPEPTVLLIETDASLRRLIALGLQYRGMHVVEANSPAILPTVEAREPDLLILDIDSLPGPARTLAAVNPAVVVLAWECPVPVGAAREEQSQLQTYTTCLSKPFDARALYTTIESLLAAASSARAAAQSQEIALLNQGKVSSSIWPLLTAAGLLLTFIGLMGLLAISAVGLCVVLVSLLWWTLGTNVEKEAVAT